MIYNYIEIKKKYGSNYKINIAISKGLLYKIENGIYSTKKYNHYLEVFTKKYPKAIISSDSAYYYHNLTDVIPKKICITCERDSSRFSDKNINQSFSIDKYYNLGKCTIEYEGVMIKTYNKERMLLELVKNKNRTPYDYYKEIIENYRKIIDDLDVYKIQKYAKVYPNGNKLLKIIQDEVF